MFPERDIANGFWYFVRARAIDKRTVSNRSRAGSKTLDQLEITASKMRRKLASEQEKDEIRVLWGDDFIPWTYDTIQDALLAYLIDQAALGTLPYAYETWLRAVVLVISDAQRDSGWLHVVACDWDPASCEGEPPERCRQPGIERDHAMTVSDDWSCLSRETFDFVTSTYAGKG
jgi:hypothetical protein